MLLAVDVSWMWRPISTATAQANLDAIYSASDLVCGIQQLEPHRLASFLIVLALGSLFSSNEPTVESSTTSSTYFNLASALLSFGPYHFLSFPTMAAVETMHGMVSYLFCSGDREAGRAAWPLLGLCSRTAQGIGLHKRWNQASANPTEAQDRSRVWWEVMSYDLL